MKNKNRIEQETLYIRLEVDLLSHTPLYLLRTKIRRCGLQRDGDSVYPTFFLGNLSWTSDLWRGGGRRWGWVSEGWWVNETVDYIQDYTTMPDCIYHHRKGMSPMFSSPHYKLPGGPFRFERYSPDTSSGLTTKRPQRSNSHVVFPSK